MHVIEWIDEIARYDSTLVKLLHRRGKVVLFGGAKYCNSRANFFGHAHFLEVQRSLVAIETSKLLLQSPAKKWWETCTIVDSRGYSRQFLTVTWSIYS